MGKGQVQVPRETQLPNKRIKNLPHLKLKKIGNRKLEIGVIQRFWWEQNWQNSLKGHLEIPEQSKNV